MKYSKIIYIVLVAFMLLSSVKTYAQYDPKFTQFMFSGLAHNPAFSGYKGGFNGRLFYRNQFTGLKLPSGLGNPHTGSLYVDVLINSLNSGVGIQADFETFGPMQTFSFIGNYAYQIKLNLKGDFLSLGVSMGFMQYGLHDVFSEDDKVMAGQVGIPLFNSSQWRPNARFGVLYHSQLYFASISASDLFNDVSGGTRIPVMHISGGYLWAIMQSFKLRPLVHMREDFNKNPTLVDLSLMAIIIERLHIGAVYRTSIHWSNKYKEQSVPVNVGIVTNIDITPNISLGYSYDIPLSGFGYGVHSGSHEISFGINFIKPSKFVSPRYF